MKEVMNKRRNQFLERCLKYLRYVLNDHFVLFLMVFLGFIALQYRQLLLSLPENRWGIYLLLAGGAFWLQLVGKLGLYVEEADQVFLLTKEKELIHHIRQAGIRTVFVWGLVQTCLQLVLLPLYMILGLPVWMWLVLLSFLWLSRYLLVQRQIHHYVANGSLDWSLLVEMEKKRQQRILRFYSLFTTVKGISSSIKERNYLNWVLKWSKKNHQDTWTYLYLRAYIRTGDFLALTIRLTLLSVFVVFGVEQSWLAIGLSFVSHYLLLFQLLGLYKVYDYQYMATLYPLDKQVRLNGFRRVLLGVLNLVLVIQMLAATVFLVDKFYVLILLVGILFLHHIYLSLKIKKLID